MDRHQRQSNIPWVGIIITQVPQDDSTIGLLDTHHSTLPFDQQVTRKTSGGDSTCCAAFGMSTSFSRASMSLASEPQGSRRCSAAADSACCSLACMASLLLRASVASCLATSWSMLSAEADAVCSFSSATLASSSACRPNHGRALSDQYINYCTKIPKVHKIALRGN